MNSTVIIRPGEIADVENMHALINDFFAKGLMLPKSRNQLYHNLRDFLVAEVDGQFAGCGALHITWSDLGEVRSLAIVEPFQGHGLGRQLVERLLQDARLLKLPRVFALTYQVGFFERLGFKQVDKVTLPHKIWGDCVDCPRFPHCDEVAVITEIGSGE